MSSTTTETEAPARTGTLADLQNLQITTTGADGAVSAIAEVPREPQRDALGRSYATGRRKDAVARVWIKPGRGDISINGKKANQYFARPVLRMLITQPFLVADRYNQFDVYCTVVGGGLSGQAGAVRHGLSRALTNYEPGLRGILKQAKIQNPDTRGGVGASPPSAERGRVALARSVFIDGEAGTTGLGIRERLRALPVTVRSLDDAHRRDPDARRAIMREVDLVVLCLPDDAARAAVATIDALGANDGHPPKILDASTAFRVAPDWTYGFPELGPSQARLIAEAPRVSNPGCYPTGAIALLRPLIADGTLPADHPVSINAVSGYTGGGRAMVASHERDGGPAFALYALDLGHKHVPEIAQHSGLTRRPIFVPSVAHLPQGMIVSIPLFLDLLPGRLTASMLRASLRHFYAGSETVQVLDDGRHGLDAAALAGSDALELRVHGSDAHPHVLLTARLDNLGKGASGAAVANIRLMLALD